MNTDTRWPGAVLLLLACAGCRQDMAQQPGPRTFQFSHFFADNRSARPLVSGTVARGQLDGDVARQSGKRDGASLEGQAATVVALASSPLAGDPLGALGAYMAGDPYVAIFPVEVNQKLLRRGQERYDIFCAMCHDRAGTGEGMIVQRGFTRPPSFHLPRLRQARAGYIFSVITRGYGAMPDYAAQITVDDRWAIVAYVRALQVNMELEASK